MSSSPHPEETQIPAEFALLALDMEKYSQIPEAMMESTRSDVDDIVTNVLADCGLPDPQTLPHSYKDGGDGAILLFPPDVLARIIDPLLGRLSAALGRYDQQRLASSPLVRLRVAVHAGPVTGPELRSGNALVDVEAGSLTARPYVKLCSLRLTPAPSSPVSCPRPPTSGVSTAATPLSWRPFTSLRPPLGSVTSRATKRCAISTCPACPALPSRRT